MKRLYLSPLYAFGSQAGLEHLFFLSLQSIRVRLMVPYHTLVLTHTQIHTRTMNASGLFTTACSGWWGKKNVSVWVHGHTHTHTHANMYTHHISETGKHVTKQQFLQVRISNVQPTLSELLLLLLLLRHIFPEHRFWCFSLTFCATI